MRILKKVAACLLVVVMTVSAAGCGSGKSAEPVEISSKEDLADLKIGVQIGTTGDSQATGSG